MPEKPGQDRLKTGSVPVLFLAEAFTADRVVGFLLIWSALPLYAAEGLWRNRR
jgi:EamA domain-containing membrane protein RarD